MKLLQKEVTKAELLSGVKIAQKEVGDRRKMGKLQHRELAAGRWAEMPLAEQMGNIGSEVSRSLRWYGRNERRFQSCSDRALELLDLSIVAAQERGLSGRLKELCRAREEFCDYFFGGNSWGTDPAQMQRYYDQFVSLA